jgi:hypothetical protein
MEKGIRTIIAIHIERVYYHPNGSGNKTGAA